MIFGVFTTTLGLGRAFAFGTDLMDLLWAVRGGRTSFFFSALDFGLFAGIVSKIAGDACRSPASKVLPHPTDKMKKTHKKNSRITEAVLNDSGINTSICPLKISILGLVEKSGRWRYCQ
ncbi:hypothetical protein [Niabella terrae]